MELEVMSMRGLVALVCAVVVVSACGRAPGAPIDTGDLKLYEAISDHSQIAVIDSRSHSVERTLPLGVPTADWRHLYSVRSDTVIDTDPLTGSTIRSLKLPGYYQLPPATLSGLPGGLSQNGQWLVLQSFDPTSGSTSKTSHFFVVETTFNAAPIRVDLPGFFQFDTISNDGIYLYLIEYVSATSYRVRMYNLPAQLMNPQVVIDKTDPKDFMTGQRLSGIPSKDGAWLYSMYVRENDTPFIHALTLQGAPIAFCIDLPGSGYKSDGSAFQWSLAMTADGTRLYAVNGAKGVVSEVNLGSSLGLARSVHIDTGRLVASLLVQNVEAKEFGANAAVVSPDGRTLVAATGSGLVLIDTADLRVRSQALSGWTVWSLSLSPDGKVVYALSDGGKIAEVSMTTGQVGQTYDSGAGYPLAIMRVATS
jgi:hypothetical protein